LRQIDQPPTDHAMDRRNRATLNQAGDGLALAVVELGRLRPPFVSLPPAPFSS
jgi:hypothetical protein